MFKVGEKVRVIPKTYTDLIKNFFLYRECWEEGGKASDKHLMLGGIYEVLGIREFNNAKQCSLLLDVNVYIREEHIQAVGKTKLCEFTVGSKVKFNSENLSLNKELQHLNRLYEFDVTDKVHTVTSILNDYYIFIDYSKSNKNAVPLNWEYFQLA